MRLRSWIPTLIGVLFVGHVSGQDLDRLTDRASKLWEARTRSSKSEALKLVEPQTHDVFLQAPETPLLGFKIAGIEFTDDPNQVQLSFKVRRLIPGVGETENVVSETWVWKDGEWFMRAKPAPTMFDTDAARAPQPQRPVFQVVETTIDAGRHAQGDVIEGKIVFKASRPEIVVIRPLDRVPGLAIGSPVWVDNSGGYLPYRWETVLLSQNIDMAIPLEAIANNEGRTAVDLRFRVRIDGKVAFKQVPDTVNPATDGQVEMQIQNLMSKPLKILSVMSYNPFYVVDDNVPESIEPGKSGRLLIRYRAQAQGAGASLGLVLSESLTPSGIVAIPLNIQIPDVQRPAPYTPEAIAPFVKDPPAGFKPR